MSREALERSNTSVSEQTKGNAEKLIPLHTLKHIHTHAQETEFMVHQ